MVRFFKELSQRSLTVTGKKNKIENDDIEKDEEDDDDYCD